MVSDKSNGFGGSGRGEGGRRRGGRYAEVFG